MSEEKPQLPEKIKKKTIEVEVESMSEDTWIPQPGDYVEYVGFFANIEEDTEKSHEEFYKREGYYPKPKREDHIKGEIYLVLKVENVGGHPHNVTVASDGYNDVRMLYSEFVSCFIYRPDGPEVRASEIQDLLGDVNKLQTEVAEVNLNTQIEDRQSSLLTMQNDNPGTSLVAPDSTRKILDITLEKSKRVHEKFEVAHQKVGEIAQHIAEKMNLVTSKIKEQKTRLQLIASRTQGQVEKLTNMVWTLELYLGTKEQIVQITTGEPCPAEVRCAVRQRLLFMDEETAVLCETGGLDFQSLEEFDNWITLPQNLNRVLPEQKGIVAFRVRRSDKSYYSSNLFEALANAEKNKENKRTYFLIRNGENTYRIWSDINVGSRLFPLKDEFDRFFKKTERNFDWEDREYKEKTEVIDPQNLDYAESVASAENRREHYLRILFILQGLLDRTPILDPKPEFNAAEGGLFKREIADRYFHFIHDDEMMLPTGRKPFWEWVKEINSRVTRGSRIILADGFASYHYWSYRDENFNSRLGAVRGSGSYCNISNPDRGPHTLEDQLSATEFKFFYYPEEWSSYGTYYREIEGRRVSVKVEIGDKWWLHFDEVNPEDVDFYIWSRLDRVDYLDMIPLLRSIKKLKLKEKEEEKPFKEWVTVAISANYGAQKQEFLDTEADDLINWWKLKYRNNRPIKADDAKALKDIMREIKKRAETRRSTIPVKNIVATIQQAAKETKQDLIVIFQLDAKHYISFYRYNNEYEFLYEKRWVIVRGNLKVDLQKDAQIINRRHRKWAKVWAHSDWEKWNKDNPRDRFLDNQERNTIIEQAKKVDFRRREKEGWTQRVIGVRQVDGRNIAIAVYFESPEVKTRDNWRTEFQKDLHERLSWSMNGRNVEVVNEAKIEEYRAVWKPKNKRIDFEGGPYIIFDDGYSRREIHAQESWGDSQNFGRKKIKRDINNEYYHVNKYFWYDVEFLDSHIKKAARERKVLEQKDTNAYEAARNYLKNRGIFRQDDTEKFLNLRYWLYWKKWAIGSIPKDNNVLRLVDETYLKYFSEINEHDKLLSGKRERDAECEKTHEKLDLYIKELYELFKDKKTFASFEGGEDDLAEIECLESEEDE